MFTAKINRQIASSQKVNDFSITQYGIEFATQMCDTKFIAKLQLYISNVRHGLQAVD